jgi:HPt (histidine-containing phosphotransfer) domain-containing protein
VHSAETTEQVYSNLADDPDLAELVNLFIANLPQFLATLHEHAGHGDWQSLERASHQLKGSSGCYGFDEVSTRAARLEDACRQLLPPDEIASTLTELEQYCGRVCSRNRPR